MLIDTHCHLNFRDFDADRADVIGNAKKAGVKKFIVPGVDMPSSLSAVNLAEKNPGIIFAAIGYHPYETEHNPDMAELEKLLLDTRRQTLGTKPGIQAPAIIVAIGECGLDYHFFGDEPAAGKKDRQKKLFQAHLHLSLKYELPVIIHCRNAFSDLFDVLDSLPSMPRAVLQCFSGGIQDIRMASQRKLFIGIDGNVTYSKQLNHVLKNIPLGSLLSESDSPYLSPVPRRGRRNEPKYINYTVKYISKILGLSPENICSITSANATQLFAI